MGIKDKERLNLCFDTRDKKQKMVFDYLSNEPKKKTSLVVDAIVNHLTGQTGPPKEDKLGESTIQGTKECDVQCDTLNKDIKAIKQSLNEVLKRLNSVELVAAEEEKNAVNATKLEKDTEDNDTDDEDALDAMLSVFGV